MLIFTFDLCNVLSIHQVGTVVESSLDFFSGRLTKKERKATLADELLSDQALTQYRFDQCHALFLLQVFLVVMRIP